MNSIRLVVAMALLTVVEARAGDFAQTIRPILSDHCFECHGPDEAERATDLRLDTKEGIEYAFAGGNFEHSEAWRRIRSDDPDERMPPPDFRKPLSDAQRDLIKLWMDEKAPWSQHWAFVKPVRPRLPEVAGVKHPIDRLVLARLKKEGLEPSAPASRETLIRRLKFDLLGLPPTLAEVDAFVKDSSPDAYEQLIDRLLASPHFGERLAIEWLDGARYADTNGYQNDFKRSMWPWRDWVINAFNDNLPYDQFLIEQLAGDLLPSPTLQQRVATGFNRNNRTVTEAGSIPAEWLVENVVDRVETTATVFLGLTMGCARCHDHKYDPISQREFYQFFSFFHNVNEKGVYQEKRGNVAPLQPVLPLEGLRQLEALKSQLTKAESSLHNLQAELPKQAESWTGAELRTAEQTPVPTSKLRLDLAGVPDALLADGTRLPPTENSGTFAWVEKIFGTVARFSGNHTLAYGQAIAPERDAPFAFTFWIKPAKMGSIVDKIDLEKVSRGFDIYWQQNGRLEVHMIHSWPDDALKVSTEGLNAVPSGRWSYVALSYDGSGKAAGFTLRVNGKQVPLKAEVDQLKSSIATEQSLRIGCRSRGFVYFGLLSDLRFFDQPLDEAAAVSIAREGLTRLVSPTTEQERVQFQQDRDDLFANFATTDFAKELREAEASVNAIQQEIKEVEATAPTVMVMEELAVPRETFVLTRGEYDKPDKDQRVTADTPQFLGTLPDDVKHDRLALARWMVSPENPLTARVRVNRLWQLLFGVGLVKTTENFGVQADAPSHPELLDWLATEFMQSGWDTKKLLKLIVTSDTYRQTSVVTPALLAKDPANRLLARGPRFRLAAEMIRDNALAVSGLLTEKIGGESIKPYQPPKLWEELAGGAGEGPYVQSHGEDLYRRSLYIYRKRTVPHPEISTFDAPSFEICQVDRARTNTPIQALALLNDTTYVEAARKLGERMLTSGGESDSARLAHGFRLATGRQPKAAELATLEQSLQHKKQRFAVQPKLAEQFLSHGEAQHNAELSEKELAAYAAVASVLLNLDETITKE